MNETSTGRTLGLFALLTAGSALIALPLFGVVRAPWDAAPAASAESAPTARPEAVPAEPARESASAAAAPRKRTRIVWMGGGSSNSPSDNRPAARPKENNPNAYRIPVNPGGSTVQMQPVGGYIATTATPAAPRRSRNRK